MKRRTFVTNFSMHVHKVFWTNFSSEQCVIHKAPMRSKQLYVMNLKPFGLYISDVLCPSQTAMQALNGAVHY